jgi:L-alanine-DL-glutamate epimerase-like enolase superfamily enzyme
MAGGTPSRRPHPRPHGHRPSRRADGEVTRTVVRFESDRGRAGWGDMGCGRGATGGPVLFRAWEGGRRRERVEEGVMGDG